MAADRFARAAVRVALRQLRVVERTSPALVARAQTFERRHNAGEVGDPIRPVQQVEIDDQCRDG
jgi:hypothetical protein